MSEMIRQYGQTVLACVCGIAVIAGTVMLLRGPLGSAVGAFLERIF